MGLLLPIANISLQHLVCSISLFEAFGRQHFNALRKQHRSFALHHHLVLQIFNRFDFFSQLGIETGQWFARQRRACFCRIALPCHGIGNVQT